MLGIGGFTPLAGFMTEADWHGVCDDCRTAPGTSGRSRSRLSADRGSPTAIAPGAEVALADPDDGAILATLRVTEKYAIDKAHECRSVFRTTDAAHPGVSMVMAQGEVNLAGPVKVLSDGGFKARYGALFMTPAETRAAFEKLGWSRVAAFQTRNPMHRSHEYLAKVAIETCDGVLVHSLLGQLKPGDIPAGVRARAIDVLLEKYFRRDTVIHAGYPLDMRYAGPREALLQRHFFARITAARISSSAAITPGSEAITGRSTRTGSSTRSRAMRSRRDRSRSTGRSGATGAAGWPPPAPVRTRTRTACSFLARNCASGCRKARRCRRSSAGRKCSTSCASTTPGSMPRRGWR